MIRALLVAVCLAVFPYQGSPIILESGNENDYEVEYPKEVAALAKGGVEDARTKTDYEDAIYEEPVVLNLDGNRLSNSRRGVPHLINKKYPYHRRLPFLKRCQVISQNIVM
nr:snake venom metalloproteinases P-III precursor [Psammophis schokari]